MRPGMLDIKAVAERLGVGDGKVRELLTSGELRSVRIGRRYRIDVEDLEAFIESKKSKTPTVATAVAQAFDQDLLLDPVAGAIFR